MRNETQYDYVNWLLSGMADMFKGAFNPDDSLSKEHWMSSFDVLTLIFFGERSCAERWWAYSSEGECSKEDFGTKGSVGK